MLSIPVQRPATSSEARNRRALYVNNQHGPMKQVNLPGTPSTHPLEVINEDDSKPVSSISKLVKMKKTEEGETLRKQTKFKGIAKVNTIWLLY
jgi:hypothetical protein